MPGQTQDIFGSPVTLWSPLESNAYDLIVIDPPWQFRSYGKNGDIKGAGAQYKLMSLPEIMALPVVDLAKRDCLLVLWACNPMLDQAFTTMAYWDFTFKTAGHWVKRTVNGKLSFGTGFLLRSAGEPFLVGTRGKPRPTRNCRSVIEGLVRAHSQKPVEAYHAWRNWTPGFRRCDLFAREQHPGFESWGDQVQTQESTNELR